MGCWSYGSGERWQRRIERMQRRLDRMQAAAEGWGRRPQPGASGNRAFDEYRAATLRRLEDEQHEFVEFLNQLRHAKDKAEFDRFMSERGRQAEGAQPQTSF